MRLFYKLILLALLPLLITVAIIITINRTLTESTLRIGMERAALEHFEAKTEAVGAYFRRYTEILAVLGSQGNFHFGDAEMRMKLLSEWKSAFPGKIHQLYYYDGHGVHDCHGDLAPWDAETLGILDMPDFHVSPQLHEPGLEAPFISSWVRVENAILGVSFPVSELRTLMESMQADDVNLFLLVDSNYQYLFAGQQASSLSAKRGYEEILNRLSHVMGETRMDSFSFLIDGVDHYVMGGLVPNSNWRVALVFDPETFFFDRETIDNLNVLILGLAMIPILLIAYAMNQTMIRPLNYLMEVQEEIGKGNLDVRAEGLPSDEIGQLGNSLNIMASNLRNMQGNLASSEQRYRALIESADHPITIMAPDTTILLINSVGARNLNLRIEECLGQSIKNLIPPLYETTLPRIQEAIASGQIMSYEDRVDLPMGPQWFWSFLQHIHLDEEPNAVLVMSYDITDKKRTEEELRYRLGFENLLADMSTNFINIEHSGINPAIVDALAVLSQFIGCDGAYIFRFCEDLKSASLTHSWNNGSLRSLDELLKKQPIQLLPGWRSKILNNQINIMNNMPEFLLKPIGESHSTRTRSVQSLCEVPLIYQDKATGVLGLCNGDNRHQWTADEGALLKFAGHVITSALQRRDAEESLVRYRAELEHLVSARTRALEEAQSELVRGERLATLGQLTATVSHELRNPLGTIRGSFFTIAERTRGKNLSIDRALERVERNIVRCDTIIEELLDFTRTRSLELKLLEPDSVVYDLVDDYPLPRNLHLVVDLETNCRLYMDAEKFRRCVVNVLNNSCEAMREIINSSVCRVGSRIHLRSEVTDNAYRLVITDNGPGIPPEMTKKIFEPLYSTKGFGVGLGLTLVQQIMEQHEGGIEVKSGEATGVQIILWLPLNAPKAEEPHLT